MRLTIAVAILFTCVAHVTGRDLPVRTLGIEQGLSNNVITTIYQDRRGFMWIGTYDGLNRYDGYNFKIFRNIIGDSTSLSTNSIIPIDGDDDNIIWVGTQNGLNVFSPGTETFSHPWFLPHGAKEAQHLQGEVRSLVCVHDRMTLVGTSTSGLIVFKDAAHAGIQIPLQTEGGAVWNYNVFAMTYDEARQRIWLSIRGRGLYLYVPDEKKLTLVSADIMRGNALRTDDQGNLWIGTSSDLIFYDVKARTFSHNHMPAKSSVTSLCYDKDGVLWIGTDGAGVFSMPAHVQTAVPFKTSLGASMINSNAVYTVYCDRSGRKWIGTLRGGINIVETTEPFFRQVLYKGNDGNNNVENFILSFCEDGERNIYIGTDGAGLRYWNRGRDSYITYRNDPADPSSISSNFITNIIRDDRGDIWLSTWFGAINRLRKNSRRFDRFTLFNTSTNNYESNAWLVYQDRYKNIWAGATNDGSLYLFNRAAGRFELFDASIVNLQCIAEDSEGNLWGGNYTSLIKIDRAHKGNVVYPIGHTVRSIREDAKGRFWLGTQDGGLLLFDRGSGHYKQFTTSDGLPSNTILRILEDKAGNLWLSTYNGLSKFDPNTYTCNNFSQSDGLQSSQFSFNGSLALRSGEFVFGGINGFNIFYPDSVTVPRDNSAVFLTGIKVDNKPLSMVKHLTLPFDRSSLSLDFVALDYTAADKIKYAYKLQGWDKTWNYVDKGRTASYSRLQEGSYVFKVKICRADGSWNEAAELLTIDILPPWYRTWWAYALFVLTAAAAVSGYIRYARRQERLRYEIELAHVKNEKDKEIAEKKLTFFTHVSHEFRAPLSLIINPIKEKLDESSDPGLAIAYRNARRMLSLVDQLLLFRKADSGEDVLHITEVPLQVLCDNVYQCFIQQAKTKHIQYTFIVPDAPILLFADIEKIETALFNLVSNAFKYTPGGGSITFEVQEEDAGVVIIVGDSGCGIAPDDQAKIFEKFAQASDAGRQKAGFGIGLFLVKYFVEAHKGSVVLESEVDKGSTFTIRLKKGRDHLPDGVGAGAEANSTELLNELAAASEERTVEPPAVAMAFSGVTASEVITEKRSMLLVDDDPDVRIYLRLLFGDRYILYMADDGVEALALADEHLPDLIISDIHMSEMDGLELCRKVKFSSRLSHIPVILLTASADAAVRLKGVEGGADDYITKPFDSNLLA
ncbi:MAG TPA: two-component regulator propeller domain-containing protein, partial [Puia sp.]